MLAALALWAAAAPVRGQIDAWYELVDSSGPGEGVVAFEQGAAGTPLVITTDDDAGAYSFTIRFVVSIDQTDPILAYAVDLVAPDSSVVSTSALSFLTSFDFDNVPVFSTGPGVILEGASQFSFFQAVAGEIELFELEMSVSEPPSADVEVFSQIGAFEWASLVGTVDIVFADSEPISGLAGMISSTPSIIIRQGQGGGGGADCNGNQIPDEEELASDPSLDCNENSVLDECDVAEGTSPDCNDDGFPDECDIADEASRDCNENGVPDECELGDGTAADCNLANGVSADCNANGTPDECDIAVGVENDCNGNGVPDACDVSDGVSQDADADGIPDECAEEEDEEEEGPQAGGGAKRPVLRRILAMLFNVPDDGNPTLSSVPVSILGEWGVVMSVRMFFREWLDLPLRMILFELAYVAWDAALDAAER